MMLQKQCAFAILTITGCVFSIAGLAQPLPADCSAAPAPKQPVEASVAGAKFTPKVVRMAHYEDLVGDKIDTYKVWFRSADNMQAPLETEVAVIVRKGQRIDGKVFRHGPMAVEKLPTPINGKPEITNWAFKNRPADVSVSLVSGYIGSLRLEFGQRKGDTITGNISLCVAKGRTTTFNSTPTKEDSYLIGTFQAQIE
jgi:hypothetical protein